MIFLFETSDLCLEVVVLNCFLANLKKTLIVNFAFEDINDFMINENPNI